VEAPTSLVLAALLVSGTVNASTSWAPVFLSLEKLRVLRIAVSLARGFQLYEQSLEEWLFITLVMFS
jgi:hypothetical protein